MNTPSLPDWMIEEINRHSDEDPCFLPFPPDFQVVLPTPKPPLAIDIKNDGQVCFWPINQAETRIDISPAGCFATHCTLIFERTGSLDINLELGIIQLTSRFSVLDVDNWRPTGQICECAADCGGAGSLEFFTSELTAGDYKVFLGDNELGKISIPLESNNLQCFYTEP
jgi:hypothetical protein